MTTVTYKVSGMTCGHCVQSVKTEVSKLGGVTNVEIDLGSGQVMVTSEETIDDAALRAAVDEAGYEVVS